MEKTSKVSIIISCYNDSEFIEDAIDSAIGQTYSNTEIIVVDDGSNNENRKVLQKLSSKIDVLIHQENKGVSAARNRGISVAKGEYIAVLDSDDIYEPEYCEKAIMAFQSHENVKIVTSYGKVFGNVDKPFIFHPIGGDIENFLRQNSALAVSFRKNDWLKSGGYDEGMKIGFEDWEFYIRLLKDGGETFVIPAVLFNYRRKRDSRSTKANNNKYELLKYIFIKHQDLYKSNFELLLDYFVSKIQKEEQNNINIKNSAEYRIGKTLFSAFRYFKSIFS